MCLYLVWSNGEDCALDALCSGELCVDTMMALGGTAPPKAGQSLLQSAVMLASRVNVCKIFCKAGK